MSRLLAVVLVLLLAGCTEGPPRPAPSIPVAQDSAMSPDLSGVTVDGFHNRTGRFHTVEVVARNTGSSTYYVYTSQSGAFSDTMMGPDGEVTTRNEMYTLICGWEAFAPGDVLRDVLRWDETIYQGQDGQGHDNPTTPAPPGHYVWTVRLTAWHEDTCPYSDALDTIGLTFQVDL